MKKTILEIMLFIAFALSAFVSLLSFNSDCSGIRQEVLRLHVIANSDSDADQQLKLYVRDCVLSEFEKIRSSCKTKEEAKSLAAENLELLRDTARKAVYDKGFSYNVSVTLENCYFPTKSYESFTLPAGRYDAVRILIGTAEGQNWWCVMFPSLCLPAVSKEASFSDILSPEEMRIIEKKPEYELRFWIVEKIEQLKEKRRK